MPDSISGWMLWGIHCLKLGAISGIMPTPMADGHDHGVEAVHLEVHPGQDADAGGGHHAEHHQARTAEHHGGQRLDQRRHLGQQAQHDQDHAAGHADEAALDTPVTATRPTFCEKLV